LRTVFFEHSARIGDRCGKIRAVLRTKQIVHARDGLFHFRRSIVQVAKQFLAWGLRSLSCAVRALKSTYFSEGSAAPLAALDACALPG